MVSPVKVPLTVDLVSAGVGEGVGVFVTALFVAVELLDEVFEALELLEVLDDEVVLFDVVVEVVFDFEVAFLVALLVAAFFAVTFAALELALALAAGAAACVTVTAAVDGTTPPEVAAEAPAIVAKPLLDNCGGVTDKTAPRPPTVPPAINNARFIPFTYPSIELQTIKLSRPNSRPPTLEAPEFAFKSRCDF